jgi:hypothetical protein
VIQVDEALTSSIVDIESEPHAHVVRTCATIMFRDSSSLLILATQLSPIEISVSIINS